MSRGTKKVGVAGRYGPRYGVKARNLIRDIEAKKTGTYQCPNCHYEAVKRVGSGIWQCRHCDFKFAGGAYSPKTEKKVIDTEEIEGEAEGNLDV